MVDSSLWQALGVALALMLIIEGVMPFLNPAHFRENLLRICQLDNKQLRVVGFFSMLLGLLLLYWVH